MELALLEKLARRETGRAEISKRESSEGRIVIYPRDLAGRPESRDDSENGRVTYDLVYGSGGDSVAAGAAAWLRYLARLFRLVPVCSTADFYLYSVNRHGWFILTALIALRLCGIGIRIHDYRFGVVDYNSYNRLLYPLCRSIEIGDISALDGGEAYPPGLCFRAAVFDPAPYGSFRKRRAVPKVIVYGDFERKRNLALVRRVHEMVKQKYPRTEFFLVSYLSGDGIGGGMAFDDSVKVRMVKDNCDQGPLFEQADMVLLLSPGGLNRSFVKRARAAGFPVIVNDFESGLSGDSILRVARDSYSQMASAIIRLVDDEEYYRKRSARTDSD